MRSLKQLRANQQNARRSAGPKTPEGRAVSGRNALTHGLSAGALLMPDEDLTAFQQLLDSLYLEHQPVGSHEEYLVRQIAVSQWRLNRLQRIETGLPVLTPSPNSPATKPPSAAASTGPSTTCAGPRPEKNKNYKSR